jgi:hypothetical protein
MLHYIEAIALQLHSKAIQQLQFVLQDPFVHYLSSVLLELHGHKLRESAHSRSSNREHARVVAANQLRSYSLLTIDFRFLPMTGLPLSGHAKRVSRHATPETGPRLFGVRFGAKLLTSSPKKAGAFFHRQKMSECR